MGRALPLNVLPLSVATQKGIRHTVFEWLKILYTFLIFIFSFHCLFKAKWSIVNGTMYKVGRILWINQTEGIPCFAILKAIYVPEQQLEDMVFLVHQLETLLSLLNEPLVLRITTVFTLHLCTYVL